MARLLFNADDVRRVVEHSIAAPKQGQQLVDYDAAGKAITKPVDQPCVLLVHDDGVYLMSNGEPRDLVDGTQSSFCAYAKGCDPKKDDDWWDRSRELVGGDDFGETLPWARYFKAQLDRGAKKIAINVSGNRISIGTPKW